MKHAYLIMAHGDFYLLKRLIKAIDNPYGDIFIHLDARHEFPEVYLTDLKESVKYSNLKIYSKVPVFWGGASQEKCEIFLMEQASSKQYGYYHLISGQDFLLRPIDSIQAYFEKHAGEEFLSVDNFAGSEKRNIERIDKYHYISTNRKLTMKVNRIVIPIQRILGIHRLKKEYVGYLAKGMNWASMTHSFVLMLLKEKNTILNLIRYSLCADEIYKQMIFNMHADEFKLHKRVKDPECTPEVMRHVLEADATMHWVDWKRGGPYVYRESDYEELIKSPYMFGRKFSSVIDKKIIDKLYKYVMENKTCK